MYALQFTFDEIKIMNVGEIKAFSLHLYPPNSLFLTFCEKKMGEKKAKSWSSHHGSSG